MFPSDMLLLSSSDQQSGMAFVETANLDGERNLKTKNSIDKIHNFFKTNKIMNLKCKLSCDKPNNNIHQFRGELRAHFTKTDPMKNQSAVS